MLELVGFVLWSVFVFLAGMFSHQLLVHYHREKEQDRTFHKLNVRRRLL